MTVNELKQEFIFTGAIPLSVETFHEWKAVNQLTDESAITPILLSELLLMWAAATGSPDPEKAIDQLWRKETNALVELITSRLEKHQPDGKETDIRKLESVEISASRVCFHYQETTSFAGTFKDEVSTVLRLSGDFWRKLYLFV